MAKPLTREELQTGLSTFMQTELRPYFDDSLRDILRSELIEFLRPRPSDKSPRMNRSSSDSISVNAWKSLNNKPPIKWGRLMRSKAGFFHESSISRYSEIHSGSVSVDQRASSNVEEASWKLEGYGLDAVKGSLLAFNPIANNTTYTPLPSGVDDSANALQDAEGAQAGRRRLMAQREDSALEKESTLISARTDQGLLPNATPHATPRNNLPVKPRNHAFSAFVTGPQFSCLSGIMVILNALCVGVDTNYRRLHSGETWSWSESCETLFCIFFACELILRIFVQRCEYFTGRNWNWHLFDLTIISLQVIEQMALCAKHTYVGHVGGHVGLLHALRHIRAFRVIRVLHLFEELHQIAGSMWNSAGVLMWSLSILFIMIYLSGVVILQFIVNAGHTRHDAELDRWFGSLSRTIFTLFEAIAGGLSWDEAVRPLISDVSPATAVFSIYISASMFAMMNMLTGVFVDRAMTFVKLHNDRKIATQIGKLFFTGDIQKDSEALDLEEFTLKVHDKSMKAYLEELNVEVAEAEGLFDLLDVDSSGGVTPHEVVDGCLRLRGPAKALDLALLMREVGSIRNDLGQLVAILHHDYEKIINVSGESRNSLHSNFGIDDPYRLPTIHGTPVGSNSEFSSRS